MKSSEMNACSPLSRSERLTEYLTGTGKLKTADLEKTKQLSEADNQSLGLMLARLGLVSDRDLASAYSVIFDRPLLDEAQIPMAPPADQSIKESFLREARIIPLADKPDRIEVATADPENEFALDALAMATEKPVSFCVGSISQIDRALDRWFGGDETDLVADEGTEILIEDAETADRLKDLASEAPVVRFVNSLIERAVERGASDIHIEPSGSELDVRYRIDGVLHRVEAAGGRSPAAVVSRVKLIARMNIAERRLPQDGRVHVRVQGSTIDLRVSTVPTIDGESVVLRILDQDRANLDLAALGFDSANCRRLEDLIRLPHGIILVTGPTGSGKTTTLYSLLQRLNSESLKLLTIEDPVEYQLEGINQIQVKPQIGLGFPEALRSIVRQDPDVIMVGEMRDLETARIAVQSALTGHLVFSTLHTNDAGSAVTRLLDMGIEDYLVTSAVNAILAQRLVRRLCQHCRECYQPVSALVDELALDSLSDRGSPILHSASGCSACDGTGYRGRLVIGELLVLDDEIRRVILDGADGKTIERAAIDRGMVPIKTDGLRKALDGLTTIEEVTRVTLTS